MDGPPVTSTSMEHDRVYSHQAIRQYDESVGSLLGSIYASKMQD
jgi:hypothetical protein